MSKNCDFRRNRFSEDHTSLDSIKQIMHALSKFLSIAKNSIEVISTTIDLRILSFVKIGEVETVFYWKTYINFSTYLAHTLSYLCGAGPSYLLIMLLSILELHVGWRWQGSSIFLIT